MKPLLAEVDAVLFDLDGTLVETNIDFPQMKREVIALAAEYGLDTTGMFKMDILAVVDATAQALTSQGRLNEARISRKRAMKVLEDIELIHAAGTREVPFARELVAALRTRGAGIGIVTRNCRRASEMSLRITAIVPDVLVSRDDCVRHKPHPDPIHRALQLLGAKAANSVMVGDHTMDIESGKAAKMKTIGFLREDRPPDFFDRIHPDYVARDMKEVLDAIIGCDS